LNILDPSLDQLMTKVDSKYALVVAAAKRGRQITEGREKVVETAGPKPVTQALKEIADGAVHVLDTPPVRENYLPEV
jgi:DNA-directed RNA polymerase subunit omega